MDRGVGEAVVDLDPVSESHVVGAELQLDGARGVVAEDEALVDDAARDHHDVRPACRGRSEVQLHRTLEATCQS